MRMFSAPILGALQRRKRFGCMSRLGVIVDTFVTDRGFLQTLRGTETDGSRFIADAVVKAIGRVLMRLLPMDRETKRVVRFDQGFVAANRDAIPRELCVVRACLFGFMTVDLRGATNTSRRLRSTIDDTEIKNIEPEIRGNLIRGFIHMGCSR